MKTIVFHSNQLCIRGTEVALYDYAYYNEILLGNKSYIVSDSKSDLTALSKFQKTFEVFLYDSFDKCKSFVKEKKASHVYYIKGGDDEKLIPGVHNAVHGVFQNKITTGDSRAYVSEWLATKLGEPQLVVPHIVSLPEPTICYRNNLNISPEQIVIGRYGGFNEFDLPFVHDVIYKVLEIRKDITFLLMNTRPFGPSHPNIVFVEGTTVLQHKSNFINTCDYMIHARNHGESFGLSICEFLFHNKPVISWKGGLDQHHLSLLKEKGLWYQSAKDLHYLLCNLKKVEVLPDYYKVLVQSFAPKQVMNQFDTIFLS
jgi:hypothetical protein